ncbi:MAG: putative maltokinase, partial [Pseudomonadota bacterium]
EDTRPYFGEGDECHMGFHFPLMPRMYMALAQEDRHPITDIIRQTPELPEGCQWAIFLRNHDELTLEMVTDRERDYLWETYAADRRARINLGIRRRLAPLMQNDRRKIELLNSLLLSMPGTPILYYGDEIGMGDNYYLGDRDGVRTPMQWSPDRNAGFSRAVPQKLYLPPIQDPLYGFAAVNVEAQQGDPSSLLNWMKRMVAVRQNHHAFGRGEMTLLYPDNRKVLAYVRRHEGEVVVCVANLSRSAQAAEIDLTPWRGRVPVELSGQSAFPPIGELPYLVTLPAFGFYWFLLADASEAPDWHRPMAPVMPDFITLTTRDGRLATALAGREGRQLERETLPRFLPLQRWFAGKDRRIGEVRLALLAELDDARALVALDVDYDGVTERYFLPLAARWGDEHLMHGAATLTHTLAKLRRGPHIGALMDGVAAPELPEALLEMMRENRRIPAAGGEILFQGADRLRATEITGPTRLLSLEQSNASVRFGDEVILKIYRRLRPGVQPDVEVPRFLTETAGFAHTPALLGAIELRAEGEPPTSLAAAFEYVANQGDCWTAITDALHRDLEDHAIASAEEAGVEPGEPGFAPPLDLAALLGTRTAELHCALASDPSDPEFAPEPITADDLSGWISETEGELGAVLEDLSARFRELPEAARPFAAAILDGRETLRARLEALRAMAPSGARTRIHGDYHLGQVLLVKTDVMIIDFEGEPGRGLEARRARTSPLRDVAGMLRSLDYAAWSALEHQSGLGADPERAEARLRRWRAQAVADFLAAYEAGMEGCPTHPEDPAFARGLLELFLMQKAGYEVAYELSSRPAWVGIPLRGLAAILDQGGQE